MATGAWEVGALPRPDHKPLILPRSGRTLPWLMFVLASTGLGAGTAYYLDRGSAARAELAKTRDEAAEYRQTLFREQLRAQAVIKERDELAGKAGHLEKTLAETDGQRQANEKLIGQLRSKLDTNYGDISFENGRIQVNLVDSILFKSGEAKIEPKGQALLEKVGSVLKELKDKQILIGGHTDDRPIHTAEFPSNWELSAARAVNVARHLTDTAGVDPHRVAASAFSQYHPRGKNKAKNRRIEILLMPEVVAKKSAE